MKTGIIILCLNLLTVINLKGQQIVHHSKYLFQPISLKAENERLDDILQEISKKGNFYFSYNSDLIQKDTLISLSVQNTTVKDILDQLLKGRFEYKESIGYIIIRPAFNRLTIVPETINNSKNNYFISGFIADETSGNKIRNASVYEKRLLKSALTDDEGRFKLRFKGDHQSVILTASKENYRDTSVLFLSSIDVSPKGYSDIANDKRYRVSAWAERTGIGKFFISSRQRIQNLNLSGFLANTPFQASLIPGLSSHGMLSPQVVNKASLNIFGGYTAGVAGVETAGLFNINRGNVKYVQVAGLSNVVGGLVTGVQTGGIMNSVLNDVNGMQTAGIFNGVKGSVVGVQVTGIVNAVLNNVSGLQVGGVFNSIKGRIVGVQVAGVVNDVRENSRGLQTAGVLNLNHSGFKGMQVAGVFNFTKDRLQGIQIGLINYSKKMDGLQIGLFNVADTSSGSSIGLFNWVNKGYHKISISANDVTPVNLAYKAGNAKLYTILSAGMNVPEKAKVYSAGFGFGHEFIPDKRISVSAELSGLYVYLGSFDQTNTLCKFEPDFRIKLFKPLSFFAGPSCNVFYSDAVKNPVTGYKAGIIPDHYRSFNNNIKGWIGWNAGITLF